MEGSLCLPAVNELRYAGRRLVDAWIAIAAGNNAEAQTKVNDAKFDCYRARHDSIDAICSKIAKDIEIIVDTFGINVVVRSYSDYTKLTAKLFDVQEKIEKSRKDRENRSEIYHTIETTDIASLIEGYRELRLAESVMAELYNDKKNEVKDKRIYEHGGFWIGVIGLVVGFAAIVVAFVK